MNFQQLKIVREAIRQKYNLTEVGKTLFTSQSGVSRSLKELEDELGVEIFERSRKRLVGLTAEGESLAAIINEILAGLHNLQVTSAELANKAKGKLVLATTHGQARYVLPKVINQFAIDYPEVQLKLHQGGPGEIRDFLINGEADIGIATEGLHLIDELITFPWYDWHHVLVAPPDHPIHGIQALTLEKVAEFPIITYHLGMTGRSHVDMAFEQNGLSPDIVLTALDADVIKTYVESGLGIGIIAQVAYDPERDRGLRLVDTPPLFGKNTTRIALRKGDFLRDFAYDFIERLSPALSRDAIHSRSLVSGRLD